MKRTKRRDALRDRCLNEVRPCCRSDPALQRESSGTGEAREAVQRFRGSTSEQHWLLLSESGHTGETKSAAHRLRQSGPCRALLLTVRTVTSSPPQRDTSLKVQTDDPSPSVRQFRLLLNGLATSELRRMFCSDKGAYAIRASAALETIKSKILSTWRLELWQCFDGIIIMEQTKSTKSHLTF